ncbi:formate dehydrogenase subunit delta [Ornithinimicrobium sediminis]|uniref:formate dehydrogenase subunit delta n=1 Tax=Ornithinimicrobium sediminis TaxID=2904603 RepID=UPI001E5A7377|nr:formate dehydrogenase subunit delta [Ornithinimicrobium sediminis]MCE0488085.1 formate dehydrogenase subunit delta [Ornithinimicrobium sediminis]
MSLQGGFEVDSEARMHEPPEIRLGGDVARAFAHYPPERAAHEIATHLRKFWEPRMRAAVVARVAQGDSRVDPLLAEAVRRYLAGDIDSGEIAEPSGG